MRSNLGFRGRSSAIRRAGVLVCCAGFTCILGLQGAATAATATPDFPGRPVRWIVPYPPGGSIDLVGRIVGQKLSDTWDQQVVVDNRPGAGGRLGTQLAASATADGYNQLLTLNTNLTVDRSLFPNLSYDPQKAFRAITIIASTSQLLVVNASSPARNLQDLIALCRSKPGQINYGSSGVGGSLHLAMELFKHMARIDIVHVAYKGGPPAAVDLVAGHIGMMFFNTPAALPYLKAGKLRALGVSSARRSPLLPEVPTIAEAGVPGFDIEVWNGLVVRTGTAPAIIQKTARDVLKVLAMPDVRRQLIDIGAEPVGNAPEEFARRMELETERWANVVRTANIRFE